MRSQLILIFLLQIIFFLGVIKLSFDDTVFTAKYPEYTTIPSLPSFYDPAIAQDSRDTLFLTCDDGWSEIKIDAVHTPHVPAYMAHRKFSAPDFFFSILAHCQTGFKMRGQKS